MLVRLVLTLFFVFLVDDVVGEGHSLTINTNVTKQQNDKILWYFNDTLIALINGDPRTSCLYDGEGGIFRDSLEVDYGTGSLTIKNIGPEHTGRFEAEIIRRESSGTSQSLNRNPKCDSTKVIRKMSKIGETIKTFFFSISDSEEKQESDWNSILSASLIGLCVAAVLLVILSVICYRRRSSENGDTDKKKLEHLLKV